MKRLIGRISTAIVIAGLCVAAATSARASFETWYFGQEGWISGTSPNTGDWLKAYLDDHGTAGSVDVTLTWMNVPDGTKLVPTGAGFLMNFIGDATTLGFSSPLAGFTYQTGASSYNADGDGYYDINVGFTSGFTKSPTVLSTTFTITGTGITVSSFEEYSTGGTKGSYFAAAHLGGYGSGISVWAGSSTEPWTPVPEPATVLAGALLLLPFGASAIRIIRKKA